MCVFGWNCCAKEKGREGKGTSAVEASHSARADCQGLKQSTLFPSLAARWILNSSDSHFAEKAHQPASGEHVSELLHM